MHTEKARVDKVDKREVLEQVVLDGRAAEQNAALRVHCIQRLVGLIIRVFQSMALQIVTRHWHSESY